MDRNKPGVVYAFGQATPLNNVYDFYSVVGQTAKQAIKQGASPEEVAQQFANNPYGVSYQEILGNVNSAAAGVSKGTTGGGSYTPSYNLSDKINALNQMYNLLYQDLGTMTQEQRGKIEQGYGQQAQTTQTGYEQTARALPLQYGAQGVGDSSYYAKAAGTASDLYNQAIKSIQSEKEQKLADLGKLYQQQMSGLQSAQAQLGNVPQYGSAQEAAALESQISNLSQQRTGLGTQAGYMGALNQIAPSAGTSPAKLQEQLSQLATSSIPSFAKQTIGEGLIGQSGQDKQYYTDYFQKLQQQGTPSQGA